MNLIQFVKGAIKRMLSPKTIQNTLQIQPLVSSKMRDAIELWEKMYMNESPWLGEDETLSSLNIASMIASEKARTATIEMEIKITGDSKRAEYINKNFQKIIPSLRTNLEYGIALGGFVMKPYIVKGVNDKYDIECSFVKATDFYPMRFSPNGEVTEAAFVDRIINKDVVYSKLEYHKVENNILTVSNTVYKSTTINYNISNNELGTQIALTDVPEWSNLEPIVRIEGMNSLLFAYFKMPEANTIDINSPLGVSGFARAVNLIKDADVQYSNLLWEFEGGQLAIDVDRTALNPLLDSNGNMKEVLPSRQNRLYRRSLDLGNDNAYNVFSPQLRDENIINGLNNIYTHIEDTCAVSRGTLSQPTYAEARTATEVRVLKQRTYAANKAIQDVLQVTLDKYIWIMNTYCDLYDIVPDGKFYVAYSWDDSIIVDKDTERQVDLLDINNGLLSKVEYRMKWMGETEEQAHDALDRIQTEREMYQIDDSNTEINAGTNLNDETTEYSKTKRANESNEVVVEGK